jgi:hypothetical protein
MRRGLSEDEKKLNTEHRRRRNYAECTEKTKN